MSEIQKALRIMGLEPGASKEAIATRYKRLIMVWHPDRFPTADGKADAEEELKKINNAKDVLYKHFDSGAHRPSGCECQGESAASSSRGTGQGASNRGAGQEGASGNRSNYDAEAQARQRDEERRRRASQAKAESERKQREQDEAKRAASSQQTFDAAKRQQAALKDNDLRWKIALLQVVLYFGLIGYAWSGYSLKAWWHDVSWNWQKDHPSTNTTTDTSTSTSTSTSTTTDYNPFGDPKPPPDNNPNMLPNGVMKPLDNSHVPVPVYPSTPTPSTTTDTTPGFNWKPVTPSTPSYGDFAPKLPPATDSRTSTDTSPSSSIDYDKYINH